MITLYISYEEAIYVDISSYLVTILSLMFTLVSIFLSICEFCLSKQLLKSDTFVIVSFEVKSNDFKKMKHKQFSQKIIFCRNSFVNKMARMLKIDFSKIERLKPIHTQNGAMFTLCIDNNIETTKEIVNGKIVDGSIARVKLY